jgi:S-adenosylmethionine synthetase
MSPIIIEELNHTPVGKQRVELVERKGTGHPDSICDAIMEQISLALSRAYLDTFGQILHHNIDKGLLVAGRTDPRLGGGRVLEPMRLVIGDRATAEYRGKRIDIAAIAEQTSRDWIRQNLRFVDPAEHLIIQNELKEGSPELTDIFAREKIGANDTSAAVGYAPLTETEQVVLDAERFLNSPEFKQEHPEAGEDIKVMAYRYDRNLTLTIALAFVDRYIPDIATYFNRKAEIRSKLKNYLQNKQSNIGSLSIEINTLDDPDRGESGVYLTVLGTSAEGGDGGQVGRGNKVNGVIALNRPMSTEAAAGKNPISHVGKIYTLLSHHIASQIYQMVPGIQEVYIWLCSQIGKPIDQPLIASAQLVTNMGVGLSDISSDIEDIIQRQLEEISDFTMRLARGEMSVW